MFCYIAFLQKAPTGNQKAKDQKELREMYNFKKLKPQDHTFILRKSGNYAISKQKKKNLWFSVPQAGVHN